jgi:3-oxoacyl-[acyl-carrier protein] reductase
MQYPKSGDLAGKVAIVTGASSAIGYAIAQLFAQHGAAVAINYLVHADDAQRLVGELEAMGGRAIAMAARS